ncbi:hypothetical protein DYB28_011216 [Aphanomyces astaci]|uniref:Uncharacterized protein n=1 Tax=Aphanomyces astaci TaxID=112090 RepID=A0A9X8DPK8_APHAT|nr:hypothetical protein DYB28_011216 [Aphanomyces astaci]
MCVKAGYVAAPMLDETSFDAATHFEFILETLKWYGQSDASIDKWFVCLIGDNCSTNKATANLFSWPLIGCHSHRLKLAVDQFLKANVSDVLSEVAAVLRFRNPVEVAVTAFAAFLNGLARRVVLTFQMTEMMVVINIGTRCTTVVQGSVASTDCPKRGLFQTSRRTVVYLVWGSPLIIILYLEDSSAFIKIVCSVPVVHRISTLHTVQFVLSMGLSVLMSFKLSQAVDNYGLRKSFQTSKRLLMLRTTPIFRSFDVVNMV